MDKKIILAVDDGAENLTAIKVILQDYFDVRLSKSPKLALELLKSNPADLILLDIEMPSMSGFDFLRYFYKTFPDEFKNIPVIIVTAHASYYFIDKAIALGVKDYIVKPIRKAVLLKKIEALIGLPDIPGLPNIEQLSDPEVAISAEPYSVLLKGACLPESSETQVPQSLDQLFTGLNYACSIHSPQEALALSVELQEKCSNISKMADFRVMEIHKLISNYEFEKALMQLSKLQEHLCIV